MATNRTVFVQCLGEALFVLSFLLSYSVFLYFVYDFNNNNNNNNNRKSGQLGASEGNPVQIVSEKSNAYKKW